MFEHDSVCVCLILDHPIGDDESAVEGDGFFRNKKRIQLTSKGQKKKAADPPSSSPAANPSPNPPSTTSRSVSVDDDDYKMSATPRGIGRF